MDNVDTAFLQSWFRTYVKGFYSEDPKIQQNIRLKEEHTIRVCNESLRIGKALNLNKAIEYHNVRELPENNEIPGCVLHSRLLRDADKLDIWYVVTKYYTERRRNPALELELPDTPEYSHCFVDDLLNNRVSNSHELKTFNDMKLLQLGWIFDVNFRPTLVRIRDRRIIDRIITALPDTADIREIKDHLKCYLDKRLSEDIRRGNEHERKDD